MNQSAERSKPTLRRRVARTLALCLALYVTGALMVMMFQRRMIYAPRAFSSATVEQQGQAEGLERWRSLAGEAIGWKRLCHVQPSQGRILIMHGNAGDAFEYNHYADVIQQAGRMDVFIVEYPGYADRPGAPSERTLEESAAAAFRLLVTNGPVYLVGESLGTGVAAYLAGNYPDKVAGVVLLAPFPRLAEVAQNHMPIFPVRLMLWDRFPAEDYLRHYHGPVAILVAAHDQVVPPKFGRRLYDGYAGPKRLWERPQRDHIALFYQPPAIWNEIIEFWKANGPRG